MQIVIDIPKEVITDGTYLGYFNCVSSVLVKTIRNGIILPKGHGRLIDADALDNAISIIGECIDLDYGTISNMLEDMPTIIEAE